MPLLTAPQWPVSCWSFNCACTSVSVSTLVPAGGIPSALCAVAFRCPSQGFADHPAWNNNTPSLAFLPSLSCFVPPAPPLQNLLSFDALLFLLVLFVSPLSPNSHKTIGSQRWRFCPFCSSFHAQSLGCFLVYNRCMPCSVFTAGGQTWNQVISFVLSMPNTAPMSTDCMLGGRWGSSLREFQEDRHDHILRWKKSLRVTSSLTVSE